MKPCVSKLFEVGLENEFRKTKSTLGRFLPNRMIGNGNHMSTNIQTYANLETLESRLSAIFNKGVKENETQSQF